MQLHVHADAGMFLSGWVAACNPGNGDVRVWTQGCGSCLAGSADVLYSLDVEPSFGLRGDLRNGLSDLLNAKLVFCRNAAAANHH